MWLSAREDFIEFTHIYEKQKAVIDDWHWKWTKCWLFKKIVVGRGGIKDSIQNCVHQFREKEMCSLNNWKFGATEHSQSATIMLYFQSYKIDALLFCKKIMGVCFHWQLYIFCPQDSSRDRLSSHILLHSVVFFLASQFKGCVTLHSSFMNLSIHIAT